MRLAEIMEKTGTTHLQLANYLGVGRATVSHYVAGRNEPDIATLCKIADYFNVSVDYLVGRDVPEEKPDTGKTVVSGNGQTIALDPQNPITIAFNGKVFEIILAEEKE